MAEVSTKDLPRNLFKVTRMTIEIVSVGVEVPNPGCGLGAFRERSVEMSGLAEQFKGCWIVNLFDLALRGAPTLWWANGHRVVPRGTGSRWRATPPENRTVRRGPGHSPKALAGRQLKPGKPWSSLVLWAPKRGPLIRA